MDRANRSRFLIKNTLIFSIGNFSTKFLSFFLIPLYTNVLSTSEYGTVDLISTISMIVAPFFVLNIAESVLRFSLDKNADHDQIIQVGITIYETSFITNLIIFAVTVFVAPLNGYGIYIYTYMVTISGSQLFLSYLRGKEQLVLYSIGNIIQVAMNVLLSVLFLCVLDMGVKGYFCAYILSALAVIIYAVVVGKVRVYFPYNKINKKLAVEMIKYSVVLIPNTFMWWIMNASDRIMVTSMVGMAANGIYAISYKLPTLISTMTTIFNQAWSYSAIREKGASDEEEYCNAIFRSLTIFSMVIGMGIIAFSKLILHFYVSKDFYTAWKYVPVLTVGCVYLTFGSFMATSYSVHKDSFRYMISGCAGAALNITLNCLLIPLLGTFGAAIATCLSYILVFVYRLFDTRRYITYKIVNRPFVIGSVIITISVVVACSDSFVAQAVNICLFVLLMLFMWSDIKIIICEVIDNIKRRVKGRNI